MIRQYKIGSTVKVAVLRGGKPMTISMLLPRAPKAERELAVYRDENFGVALRDVTYSDRLKQSAAPDENGALVTSVQSGSWAALAGLQANDIVHKIDDATVRNMSEARAVLRGLEKSRPRNTVFFVTRGVRTLYVEAQTDWAVQATP